MARTLEVLVAPNGETTVQTHGFRGAGCLDASRFLEVELGLTLRDQKTTEYFQIETSAEQQLHAQ